MSSPETEPAIIQTGRRYLWGELSGSYAIWDRKHPDTPIAEFGEPERLRGWLQFQRMEQEVIERRRRFRLWGRR